MWLPGNKHGANIIIDEHFSFKHYIVMIRLSAVDILYPHGVWSVTLEDHIFLWSTLAHLAVRDIHISGKMTPDMQKEYVMPRRQMCDTCKCNTLAHLGRWFLCDVKIGIL